MLSNRLLITIFLLSIASILIGCGPKFSAMFSESWSENHARSIYDAEASLPEINDGDLKTWGVTRYPEREYSITLPEVMEINRIVVYSGNVIAYQIVGWDAKNNEWKPIAGVGSARGRQRVRSYQDQLKVPRFDHRMNFKTNKIRLEVIRAETDGPVITRNPGKDDRILNHKVEYIGTGRNRLRVDIYEVYMRGPATIREIEIYSHLEKPEIE